MFAEELQKLRIMTLFTLRKPPSFLFDTTRRSLIDVPPPHPLLINFEKIFHPGHSYSTPPVYLISGNVRARTSLNLHSNKKSFQYKIFRHEKSFAPISEVIAL